MTEQYEKELREALEIEALPSDTDELIKLWEDRCEDHLRKYGRQVHHTLQEAAQTLADILPDLREMIEAREKAASGKWEYIHGPAYKGRYHTVECDEYMVCECHDGDSDDEMRNDARFITTAANNITKIAERIGGDDE